MCGTENQAKTNQSAGDVGFVIVSWSSWLCRNELLWCVNACAINYRPPTYLLIVCARESVNESGVRECPPNHFEDEKREFKKFDSTARQVDWFLNLFIVSFRPACRIQNTRYIRCIENFCNLVAAKHLNFIRWPLNPPNRLWTVY